MDILKLSNIENVRQIRMYEKAIFAVESFDNYNDIRELFKHFFRCSALDRMDIFDFDKAFRTTIPFLERKLDDHGVRSFRQFFRNMPDDGKLSCLQNKSKMRKIKAIYKTFHKSYQSYKEFINLQKILDEYEKLNLNQVDYKTIAVFDSVIHAEHTSGCIFEWEIRPDDPNSLRVKVEKELLYKIN